MRIGNWRGCDHKKAKRSVSEEQEAYLTGLKRAEAGTITALCHECGVRVGVSWGEQKPWVEGRYVRTDVTEEVSA